MNSYKLQTLKSDKYHNHKVRTTRNFYLTTWHVTLIPLFVIFKVILGCMIFIQQWLSSILFYKEKEKSAFSRFDQKSFLFCYFRKVFLSFTIFYWRCHVNLTCLILSDLRKTNFLYCFTRNGRFCQNKTCCLCDRTPCVVIYETFKVIRRCACYFSTVRSWCPATEVSDQFYCMWSPTPSKNRK